MRLIKMAKGKITKTHLFNVVTARLYQRKRRKELYGIVGNVIKKYQRAPMEVPAEKLSNYIWVCWWQGEQGMSPIVRECYRRICQFNQDKQVVLITEDNLDTWVSFPDYILEKYKKGIITKTHFSDLLRAELLARYGGIWMDITIYTYSGVLDKFYDYPVFTGHFPYNRLDYNVSKNRWTSFFFVSRYPNNVLFSYLSDFWHTYWEKADCLIEYFLVDYAIDMGYRKIPAISKELDMVPINGCGNDVWQLLKVLPCDYDDVIQKEIESKNWMQKLSYKGETNIQNKSVNPKNSFYRRLFLEHEIKWEIINGTRK